tara:strand:+ start:2710 stop:3084 length:375 start_codon:yes stop_codon:yes gene_type:complete
MPEYIYEHPDTGEQVIVLQSVHEEHIYEINGVVYDRVYTVPNASIDTNIDPFSAKEFREKAKGSTVGDFWDQSAEASEKRTQKEGVDPVKNKFFEDYSKTRKGAKHPQDPSNKSNSAKKNFDIG